MGTLLPPKVKNKSIVNIVGTRAWRMKRRKVKRDPLRNNGKKGTNCLEFTSSSKDKMATVCGCLQRCFIRHNWLIKPCKFGGQIALKLGVIPERLSQTSSIIDWCHKLINGRNRGTGGAPMDWAANCPSGRKEIKIPQFNYSKVTIFATRW